MESQDARVRGILEVKEHLLRRAEECETELEYIRRNIAVLDSVIKQSSFTRASEMPQRGGGEDKAAGRADAGDEESPAEDDGGADEDEEEPAEDDGGGGARIEVGGRTVARAAVTPTQIRITLEGCELGEETPPLRSFLVEHVIGGMRESDEAAVREGRLEAAGVISCEILRSGGIVGEIVVTNYRDPARADEIVSAAEWTLARMLESSSR